MSANHPNLSPKMRAMAARLANKFGLEKEDVLQELEAIRIEHAGNYDLGIGASRETYYLSKLQGWCKGQRSEARFGFELDDEEKSDHVEAMIAGAAAGGEIAPSRFASDVDVDERIAILPDHLRAFGQRFVAGMSCKEAADDLGMTDRRARQVVEEIVAFFSVCTASAQPSLL